MKITKTEFLKQRLPTVVGLVGVLAFVAGIVVLAAAGKETVAYRITLFRVAGILFFAVTGLSAYYIWLTKETDPNFFLFNRETRRNIPLSALTFATVNERMDLYLSLLEKDEMDLWQGRTLAEEKSFGEGAVYRPLVAYKMLYNLILHNDEDHWLLFEEASSSTVRLLSRAIERAGDKDMAEALLDLYTRNNVEETENIRDFLMNNQEYIKERMLRYVVNYINFFY